MRKPLLLLSLAVMLGGPTATARSLSPAEALGRVTGQSVSRSTASASVAPVMTVGQADAPALYVFNRPEGGWMIVSADDVAIPLVGYSDSGSIDPADLPDNFKGWLDLCADGIRMASDFGAEPYSRSVSRAGDPREPIAPLVATRWDQGAPYNTFCPKSSGRPTYTGCVATAMAQVMKYHNWPDKVAENANLSYKWNNETLTEDFSNYEFDWAGMTDTYTYGQYTETQADAVAKLMQACGYSLRMRYASDASAAYQEQVGNALVSYFRYALDIHNEFRSFHTTDEWEQMVYDNLKNCGPMVYWGGAHCFVCDGYDKDGYFHFNWGWSGLGDGYFSLSMLKPSSLGTGGGTGDYTSNQGALFGIKPSTGADSPRRYTFCIDDLTNAYAGNTYFNIHGTFVNRSPYTVSGEFIYQIFSEDGSKKISTSTVVSPVCRNWGIDIVTGNTVTARSMMAKISGLPDGTYRVYPAVRIDGEEYNFQCPPTVAGYVLITVKSGQIVESSIPKAGDLIVENIDTHGDFYIDSSVKISGVARFTGRAETSTAVKAVLLNPDKSVRAYSNSNITLDFSPEGTPFEFVTDWFYDKGLSVDPGEWTFAIAMVENGAYTMLGTCPVTVNSRVPKPTYKSPITVSVANAEAVDPNDIKVSVSVEGLTGVVYRDFELRVFQSGFLGTVVAKKTVPVYVSAGRTATETVSLSLPKAVAGQRYYVVAVVNNAGKEEYVTAGNVYFTIGDTSGITDIEADGNAPVEYFNIQGMPVNADNLTPGIYIRRQGGNVTKIQIR